jgi:heme/copper-type cytochrome/quinol oxidase subunit 2
VASTPARHSCRTTARFSAGGFVGLMFALPLAAQARTPPSYMTGYGTRAYPVVALLWGILIISIVVVVAVSVLLLLGLFRRRSGPVSNDPKALPLSRPEGGLPWLYIGSGISTVALLGTAFWSFAVLARVANPDRDADFHIEVIGHQWWWEVRYHVCTEYCGQQHAHMGLVVLAESPQKFQDWWDQQLQDAPAPASPQIAQGELDFVMYCGACHTVRGTGAGGVVGPDLTHIMTRQGLAAETLPNTIGYLSGWISDPQRINPGNLMPTLALSAAQLTAIRSFMQTLQ